MATLTTAWADHVYNLVNRGVLPPALAGAVYLRLFTADPGSAGVFSAEVTGGGYTGQNIATVMGPPSNGSGTSTGVVLFTNMPAVVVAYWAKCRTPAGRTAPDEMIEHGPVTPAVTVTAGQTFAVAVADLDAQVA